MNGEYGEFAKCFRNITRFRKKNPTFPINDLEWDDLEKAHYSDMQRKRLAEVEQLNCELNYIRRVTEDRVKEAEQKLRAEQEHSKQLVADCRTCKLVQKLEAEVISLQTVADCSLTGEIQRENLAESMVEHLQSEVDALQNDLSIAKEANKRYRAQLSQRNGLVSTDKAIK